MEPAIDLGVGVYVQLFILVFSLLAVAFFSSSEASLISVNKIRMRHLVEQGNDAARAVVRVVEGHEKFFATILLKPDSREGARWRGVRTEEMVARLERRVKSAFREAGLVGSGRLVVAVSGGPDSLALIVALTRTASELGLDLHGAHLDHGLRGDASRADARFVVDTFQRLGVPLTCDQADVAGYRKSRRLSLEEAARDVRYAFLARVARDQRADTVALGHNADDQAETVLMHAVRGSGLTGLRGMEQLSRRELGGEQILLVRPLLGATKSETAQYCAALGLKPRLDQSNLSAELTRNRVRMELVPMLERLNPAVRDAIVRLSRTAAQQLDLLDTQVDAIWGGAVSEEGPGITIDRESAGVLHTAILAHLLRRAVTQLKGDLDGIEQAHLDGMVRLMGGQAGRGLDLPGGIRFSVGYSGATLAVSGAGPCPLSELENEHFLVVPGETQAGNWRAQVRVVQPPEEEDATGSDESWQESTQLESHENPEWAPGGLTARISYRAVGAPLRVRKRRPGDRFQPLGMSGRKKIQDFMVDAKIPRGWRDRVPLVVSPRGIAWVAGWRIADWAKVTDPTEPALELSLTPYPEPPTPTSPCPTAGSP